MNKEDLKTMRDQAQANIDKADKKIDEINEIIEKEWDQSKRDHYTREGNRIFSMREIYFSQLQNVRILEELNEIRERLEKIPGLPGM